MPITTEGRFYREVHTEEDYILYNAQGYKLQFDCNDNTYADDMGGWVNLSHNSFLRLSEARRKNPEGKDEKNYKFRAVWKGNIEDMP